jgi:DNA-binding SARP family transcriptional activator/tetratricopeptide (TPR) repeat protein
VAADGAPVALGAPQQRALLALLLLDANEAVSRDRLVDGLWGDKPPASAAKLVQIYVSRLRKVLEPRDSVLVTRPTGYMLRVAPGALDLDRFEDLAREGREALAAGAPDAAARHLREALALWRGPPLADFTFEPFAAAEIGRLGELRLAALEDRVQADLDLGTPGLTGELELLIARHPLRERLRGQLMLALYRSGRQSEALEAYRETRRSLVDAVGIEPGPELQRLEQAILRQDASLDPPPVAAAPVPAATAPLQDAEPPVSDFVGRAEELRVLLGALDEALAGRGGLVLVAGPPGIGKSRLLDELALRAVRRGARVLRGRCWEAGGAPPYWPWFQSLRELGDPFADVPDAARSSPEAARFALFEAVAELLAGAAATAPLVLVLDDLHAADEPSLLLLQFVAGQVRAPLLVVGAYRDEALEPDTPLAAVAAELARERATRMLALSGLAPEDVARLIATSAGEQPPERSVAAIYDGTEGNPLFVGEVVRLLSADGRLAGVGDSVAGVLPIPPGVREVIGRRLRLLSDDCRATLTLAAVLGREFSFDALAAVSERAEEALLDDVEEGLRAQVLSELPGSAERLRFAHVMFRDALYGELRGPRRVRLHRDVGAVLEQLYATDRDPHLGELAYHYVAAGEAAKAVEYARVAGDRAVRLTAYEEAVRLYGMALDAHGDSADPARGELLLALADAQARAGDDAAAKPTYLRAAELARSADLTELLARTAIGYGGRAVWMRALTDEALVPLLEDAIAAIGEQDSVPRVLLLSRLAAAIRSGESRERRETLTAEAVASARRLGDPTTLASALAAAEAGNSHPGRGPRRLAEAAEIVSLSIATGDDERLVDGHDHAFWAAWELGDPARRAAELAGMIDVSDRLAQPAQLWMAAAARAALSLSAGRFEEAETLIDRAAATGERALRWNATAARKLALFVLRGLQERPTGFEDNLRDTADDFPSPLVHGAVHGGVLLRTGSVPEATAVFAAVCAHDLVDWHLDEEWLFSMSVLAETCHALGDVDRAGRLYEVLSPFAALNAIAVPEVALDSVSRPLGLLATLLGRHDDAERHFEDALEMNTRMGAWPWVAHTESAYAELLAARGGPGDAERAGRLAVSARERYRSLGMEAFAGRVYRA